MDMQLPNPSTMEPAMQLALDASFGSVGHWREALVIAARAQRAGPGWMRLVFQPAEGTLVNQWAAEPDQAPAGGVTILALDLHGVVPPAGHRGASVSAADAFIGTIDWHAVHERYQQAVHAASETVGISPDGVGDQQVLDVRRAGVFEQARTMIPGARWCDPATIATWCAEMSSGRALVVYCVHGHEVSRTAALRLRAAGLDARYLQGGIAAWQVAGRALVDKPVGTAR